MTKSTRHMLGASLLEAIVAIGVLGVAAYGISTLSRNMRAAQDDLANRQTQAYILDRYLSLARNPGARGPTLADVANGAINAHLAGTDRTATSPRAALRLRHPNSLVAIPSGGLYLDKDAKATAVVEKRRWHLQAWWEGRPSNAAAVILKVSPTDASSRIKPRTVQAFWRFSGQSCKRVAVPVIAGSNGLHQNWGAGTGYIYDEAVVSCGDPNYYRTGVSIEPGCHSPTARSLGFYWDSNGGACFQISAVTTEQQGTCAAGEEHGTCTIICCRFD